MDQQTFPRMSGPPEARKYMRLPAPGQRDPLFGFSRSFINSLILPCKQNDYTPPVLSFVPKKRGARCGVRLVDSGMKRELTALEACARLMPEY